MAFNLLPIAPLDGSKIVHMFVPVQYEEEYMKLMMYGPYILLALIIATNFINISILSGWISLFMMPILDTMGIITALIF